MLILGEGIGCVTDCYHPSNGDTFPNPYPSDESNPESPNPTHGKPPTSLRIQQQLKYGDTCHNPTQTNSDSGSSGLSSYQLSSLPPPIIDGESINGNEPFPSVISISQGTTRIESPYILTPETSVGIGSAPLSPLKPLSQEGIFSRSVRKSPRDFKREVSEQ